MLRGYKEKVSKGLPCVQFDTFFSAEFTKELQRHSSAEVSVHPPQICEDSVLKILVNERSCRLLQADKC